MKAGCLRYIIYAVLILLCCLGVLLWKSGGILESLLQGVVDDRGGEICVSDMSIHPESGLTVYIQSYSEPAVIIEDVVFQIPWSGLINYREALEFTVRAGSVQYLAKDREHENSSSIEQIDVERISQFVAGMLEGLSHEIGDISVLSIVAEVGAFEYRVNDIGYGCSVQMSVVQSLDDVMLIELSGSNEVIEFNSKTRIAKAQSVAIDFAAALSDWSYFSNTYLPPFQRALSHVKGDVSIEALSVDRFAEASGYIRWNAETSDEVSAALLANIGAIHISSDIADFTTEVSSIGVATNGGSVVRGYAKTPLRSLQVGDFQSSGGKLNVHLDDAELHIRGEVEGHSLEVRHQSVFELLQGHGRLTSKIDSDEINSDMVSALGFDLVPPGLIFSGDAHVEGDIDLLNWQPVEIRAVSKIDLSRLELLSQLVVAEGVTIQSDVEIDIQNIFASNIVLDAFVSSVELAGVPLSSLHVGLHSSGESEVFVDRFDVNVFSGKVIAKEFTFRFEDLGTDQIDIDIESWDLEELAESIPQFEGELSGRVSGQVALAVEQSSIQLSGGKLSLDSGVDAHLAYALNGLLTQGVPKGSQAFESYQMAERAFEDLKLERLELNFFPESDQTKPIKLTLYGESDQDRLIVPVNYTLNVNSDDSAGLIQLLQQIQRSELEFN